MVDRAGRPTFQDWAGLAQGFQQMGAHNQQQQQMKRQEQIRAQTYEAAKHLMGNPEAAGNIENDPALSQMDPEALYKGHALYLNERNTRMSMEAAESERNIARSEEQAAELTKAFAQAKGLYQQGHKAGAAEVLTGAYNQFYPDGYKAALEMPSAAMDGQGPGEPMIRLTSPLGNQGEEPLTVDDAIRMLQENPNMFDPKALRQQQVKTAAVNREFNFKNMMEPEVLRNEQGEQVYRTWEIDPIDNAPIAVYSDTPLYYPDAQVIDVTDKDGYRAEATIKRMLEEEQKIAELGKIKEEGRAAGALADKRAAETKQIKAGGGTDTTALEKNTRFIDRILANLDPSMPPEHRMREALDLAQSSVGKTRDQFRQELVLKMSGSGFMTPGEIAKSVEDIMRVVYPDRSGGGAPGGGGKPKMRWNPETKQLEPVK